MDEVNVAVIAPILGRDLSFASDVDSRVRVLDTNFAATGHRAGAGGQAAHDPVLLGDIEAMKPNARTHRTTPDPADTAHLRGR